MSVTKAQLIQPVGVFTSPGVNVSGILTASSFSGNLTGNVAGLTGTPNVTVGVITATSFFGSGANLTGVAGAAYVGQSTTSQSPTTTINLSLGNVVYFTHNTDTTVAFANTSTTQEVRFIRTKDDNLTPRTITWPSSITWNGGSAPTLINSASSSDAQIFNLTTKNAGVTWYAYQEFSYGPATEFYSWGSNTQGHLGQNNTTNFSSPIQIPGTTWSSVSAAVQTTLSTKTDGTLWSWGRNDRGQLGQNNITYYSSPVQIPGTTWSSISAGYRHILATKTDNTLWAWGNNGNGSLGQNNRTYTSSPVQIPGTTWRSTSTTLDSSFAIKTDGTLWSWGYNGNGNLGVGDRTGRSSPVQVPGNTWSSIPLGYSFIMALKTDNTLWGWGANFGGVLGQSDQTYASSPVQIPGTTWSSVKVDSYWNTTAVKTDGTLWSWGYNYYGNLGHNNRTSYSSPQQITGTTWSRVFGGTGTRLTFASKTDGTLWAWGDNGSGQLGINNTTTRYSSPVQVPGNNWTFVATSNSSAFAIKQTY